MGKSSDEKVVLLHMFQVWLLKGLTRQTFEVSKGLSVKEAKSEEVLSKTNIVNKS